MHVYTTISKKTTKSKSPTDDSKLNLAIMIIQDAKSIAIFKRKLHRSWFQHLPHKLRWYHLESIVLNIFNIQRACIIENGKVLIDLGNNPPQDLQIIMFFNKQNGISGKLC